MGTNYILKTREKVVLVTFWLQQACQHGQTTCAFAVETWCHRVMAYCSDLTAAHLINCSSVGDYSFFFFVPLRLHLFLSCASFMQDLFILYSPFEWPLITMLTLIFDQPLLSTDRIFLIYCILIFFHFSMRVVMVDWMLQWDVWLMVMAVWLCNRYSHGQGGPLKDLQWAEILG